MTTTTTNARTNFNCEQRRRSTVYNARDTCSGHGKQIERNKNKIETSANEWTILSPNSHSEMKSEIFRILACCTPVPKYTQNILLTTIRHPNKYTVTYVWCEPRWRMGCVGTIYCFYYTFLAAELLFLFLAIYIWLKLEVRDTLVAARNKTKKFINSNDVLSIIKVKRPLGATIQ